QFERGIRSLGVYEFGVLQLTGQLERRSVIAYGGDANPGPVGVGDAADRGLRRHQQGVVELKDRGREVADVGRARVERQEQQVAGASLEAADGLRRSGMFQERRLNAQSRGQRPDKLDPDTLKLAGRGVLGVLREEQADPDLAGAGEVGHPRVGVCWAWPVVAAARSATTIRARFIGVAPWREASRAGA